MIPPLPRVDEIDLRYFHPFLLGLGLFLLGVLVVLPGLTDVRPLSIHEIYVAQTAGEMLKSGDYLIPTYNGDIRLQKPPLSYWLTILTHHLIGDPRSSRVTAFEARVPSALAAIGLLFVLVGIGTVAFEDRRIGWMAAALLGTTWGFHFYAHNARPEMLYTLFCGMEMWGFLRLQRTLADPRANQRAGLLAWGGFAGAIMAKGPLFPLFIFLGIVSALFLQRPHPPLLRSLRPFMGLVFVLSSGMYFLYLASTVEEAWSFWGNQMVHPGALPLWQRPFQMYFLWPIVYLLLPWSVLLVLPMKELWDTRPRGAMMLAMGVLVPFAFVSFSAKLRMHYVLPILPFLCALMAWGGVRLYDSYLKGKIRKGLLGRILGCYAWVVAVGTGYVTLLSFRVIPETDTTFWPVVLPWTFLGITVVGASWFYRFSKPVHSFFCLIIATGLVLGGMGFGVVGWRDKWHKKTAFAQELATLLPENVAIATDATMLDFLLYYQGGKIHNVPFGNLQPFLETTSTSYIVYGSKEVEKTGVKGRVLLQGRRTEAEGPVVLVEIEGKKS
jgi:4-amino-4-deoxy-L-arabinose transferase-like glycosyltransferase